MPYAKDTKVPVGQSKAEIEQILTRYGVEGFMSGHSQTQAFVAFAVDGREVRIDFRLPSLDDKNISKTEAGKKRTPTQTKEAQAKETRRMWRAAALVIKAKLEAIESRISTFDQEFLAHLVLPSGQTIGETILPRLDETIRSGNLPQLLPGPEDRR